MIVDLLSATDAELRELLAQVFAPPPLVAADIFDGRESQPVARIEDVDPLGLDDRESLVYLRDLQRETRALRDTVHAAGDELARLTHERVTMRRVIADQRQQLRRLFGGA